MDARIVAVIVTASMLASTAAVAACPPGHKFKNGCVNLDGVATISQQIVAQEPAGAAPKGQSYVRDTAVPYTGPTVGVSSMGRRAPTVGYRWALQ